MQTDKEQKKQWAHNFEQQLLDNLPAKPYCGQQKCCTNIWPASFAIKTCSHIQFNHPNYKQWLVIDCDHEHLDHPKPFLWEEKSLPPPNFIVQNRDNGRFHVYYLIHGVSIGQGCRTQPQAYYRAIYRALVEAWEGDENYTQGLSKNPLSDQFQLIYYHEKKQSLYELHDYLPDVLPFPDHSSVEDKGSLCRVPNIQGIRNSTLFDEVRMYAYKAKGCFKDYNPFLGHIKQVALRIAPISADFKRAEVLQTARSIARWVWINYTGKTGKIDLTAVVPDQRMTAGAKHTNKVRKRKSAYRLIQAFRALKSAQGSINRSTLAKHAGLSRQALYGPLKPLTDLLLAIAKPQSVTTCNAYQTLSEGVKYRFHQIIAPWGSLLCDADFLEPAYLDSS